MRATNTTYQKLKVRKNIKNHVTVYFETNFQLIIFLAGSSCRDTLADGRCALVVQARMCRVQYYRNQCCRACADFERTHPQDES